MMSTVERGRWGEDLAAQALTAHGCEVVERNWHCPVGEIDLIAQEAEVWIFVEVKLRQGDAFGTPEEAVTSAKQTRLLECAQHYLTEHDLDDVSWRIDVVAIELAASGKVQRLDIYQDAVRADG